MRKILFVNPVGHNECNEEVKRYLESFCRRDTEVYVESLEDGLPKHLEYGYYEVLIGEKLLSRIKKAEMDGYDAAIIGCYFDPFLDEAREICNRMVVTAPAEAAMHIGTTLGNLFSVLVVRNKTIPQMRDYVYKNGNQKFLASFRSLNIGVRELQKDPKVTKNRMREEIKKAIEQDGAEIILLGCTAQYGFFKELQEEFRIPIIDANVAPLKYAEFLCDIRDCGTGWYVSKSCKYETPNEEELREWGTDQYFRKN